MVVYAKAHPAKINMGSAGYGSAPHVFGELFKMMAGVNMVHVPMAGCPRISVGRVVEYQRPVVRVVLTTDDGIEAAALLPDQVYYSQPVGVGRRQRCHGRRRPPASWDTEHVGSANRDRCK
jgi:hypothetical protein